MKKPNCDSRQTGNHTWDEVALRLTALSGKKITRQKAWVAGERLFKKLRIKLLEYPEIREWLSDQGIEVEDE